MGRRMLSENREMSHTRGDYYVTALDMYTESMELLVDHWTYYGLSASYPSVFKMKISARITKLWGTAARKIKA